MHLQLLWYEAGTLGHMHTHTGCFPTDPEESSDDNLRKGTSDDGLGEGAVAAIVIIVFIVVGSVVAVSVVIVVFFHYKKKTIVGKEHW